MHIPLGYPRKPGGSLFRCTSLYAHTTPLSAQISWTMVCAQPWHVLNHPMASKGLPGGPTLVCWQKWQYLLCRAAVAAVPPRFFFLPCAAAAPPPPSESAPRPTSTPLCEIVGWTNCR